MKAIIPAGGVGTRLLPLTKSFPKAMVKINGKPLLQYQVELLKKNGFTEIILVINHLGEKVKKYFQNGEKFGIKINYFFESFPMGTAGAISSISKNLSEDFLVIYGDLLTNLDLNSFIKFHQKHKGIASLVVHPNNHPRDSDLLEVNKNSKIISIYSKPHKSNFIYHNLVNAAIYILSPKINHYIPENIPSDFGKDIFPTLLLAKQNLYGYQTHEYIKDIGTIKRLKEANDDVKNGLFKLGNRLNKRKTIFIDRDGVINKEMDNIVNLKDVQLINKTSNAIKRINNSNYLAIVISNQPQAAKGLCKISHIKKINKKIETLLGDQGAYLNRIYTCLHHPDKGFPEETPKLKIKCNCRKPKTGMINTAVRDFNINISQSYLIGDTTTDALTAKNAGLKFIGVRTGYKCQDKKYNQKIKTIVKDLPEAIKIIMKKVK